MAVPVKVFVSYSWGVERDTGIVDELGVHCQQRNIQLIRDRETMQHGDLIRNFMDNLSGGEHVITVFSEAYFKSKWCMYELLKTYQKGDFAQRTHAIIADDCDLQDENFRFKLSDFWREKYRMLDSMLNERDRTDFIEEQKQLELYRDFYQKTNKFLNFAAGRVTTKLSQLQAQNYAQIFDLINSSLHLTAAPTSSVNQKGAMSMGHLKAKKIHQLEEQIASLEETLHNFELELIDAYHHAQKSSLKKDIHEKKEQLKTKNSEYAAFLSGAVEDDLINDGATAIWKEIESLIVYQSKDVSKEMQEKLNIILHEIQVPNKSANAKLKIALPIIPMLVNYELELDAGNFLGELWGRVRGLLNKKTKDKLPEDPSVQAASVQSKGQARKKDSNFLTEIQKHIAKALSVSGMSVYTQVLWQELNKVLVTLGMSEVDCEPMLIAEQLVLALQQGGKKCPVINKALTDSVERCLDKKKDRETYENAFPHHKEILDVVEQVLGYLVLSLVDKSDARNVSEWLQNDLNDLYFELYIRTLGGVELFIARHQERKSNLKLDENKDDVTGMHLIYHNTDVSSWSDKARLDEVQRIIWSSVYKKVRSIPLEKDEIRKLGGRIRAKMESDSSCLTENPIIFKILKRFSRNYLTLTFLAQRFRLVSKKT